MKKIFKILLIFIIAVFSLNIGRHYWLKKEVFSFIANYDPHATVLLSIKPDTFFYPQVEIPEITFPLDPKRTFPYPYKGGIVHLKKGIIYQNPWSLKDYRMEIESIRYEERDLDISLQTITMEMKDSMVSFQGKECVLDSPSSLPITLQASINGQVIYESSQAIVEVNMDNGSIAPKGFLNEPISFLKFPFTFTFKGKIKDQHLDIDQAHVINDFVKGYATGHCSFSDKSLLGDLTVKLIQNKIESEIPVHINTKDNRVFVSFLGTEIPLYEIRNG